MLYVIGTGMKSEFRKSMGTLWHMWQALVIQDGVWPPSWITVLLIFTSNLIVTSWNLADLFLAGSFMLVYIFVNVAFEMTELFKMASDNHLLWLFCWSFRQISIWKAANLLFCLMQSFPCRVLFSWMLFFKWRKYSRWRPDRHPGLPFCW